MAATLEQLGHEVVEDQPPALREMAAEVAEAGLVTWSVGCRANLGLLASLLGRPLGPDDVEPCTWALSEAAAAHTAVDLARAQATAARFRRRMAAWWEPGPGGFHLLLTPTTAEPPPPIGELTSPPDDPLRALFRSFPYAVFTSPFNGTGQPAISVPSGTTPEGLPLGAQLVAAYGREDLLVAVAAQLEAARGWAQRRPPAAPAAPAHPA